MSAWALRTLEEKRPREGWLSLLLLLTAVWLFVGALLEAEWVEEDGAAAVTAVAGLLLAVILAKRPLHAAAAWLLLTLYGLLTTTLTLGRLIPPPSLWNDGGALYTFWREQGALLYDRAASWLKAVSGGGSSEETIVFAFGLGVLAWLLTAYLGWSTYRQQRPLRGISLLALAMAINNYYGSVAIYWLLFLIAVAVFSTAVATYNTLQSEWERRGVDYSEEIQIEFLAYAGGISLALVILAYAMPAFSITRLTEAFLRQTAVQETEETLGRVFAGVNQPREEAIGRERGSGVLPRSYLLGNTPELAETVVMTAVVTPQEPDSPLRTGPHWRGFSYDIYTGRGWAFSDEREERIPAGTPIPLPDAAGQSYFRQEVNWIFDDRFIRYTMGQPLTIDQDVIAVWRGLEDFVRIQSETENAAYRLTSRLTTAPAAALAAVRLEETPPIILARYTALPDSVPQRVHDLAQEVAGDAANPYAQAKAIEQFLHQYPYSLDVPPPPVTEDPVDFFLFDLQTGYCDYYASTMVVMARSLGLPARLAIGYLAQPPDENGVQTIYQVNGHSWAEVYFAGYGWVEFEPTAPFAGGGEGDDDAPADYDSNAYYYERYLTDEGGPPPPAIPPADPEPEETRPSLLWLVGVLLLLLAGGALIRRRQRQPAFTGDAVTAVYGRLQHQAAQLGAPSDSSLTPQEFCAGLLSYLNRFEEHPRLARHVQKIREPLRRLTDQFVNRQYGPDKTVDEQAAEAAWRQIQPPLRLLRLFHKIRRL